MSKKMPSITEQIAALENENKRLKEQEKLVAKIRSLVAVEERSSVPSESIFEKKIVSYFGLKSESDKNDFLKIMLSDSSLNFFNSKRNKEADRTAEQDS